VGKIEHKTTNSGVKLSSISMVTNKKYVKNGEKHEKVTWHNITLFSKLAEIAEKYVGIGDLLYVQGEMDNQKYVDSNGQERTRHFIMGHDIKLMPKNKEHVAKPDEVDTDGLDDVVPF